LTHTASAVVGASIMNVITFCPAGCAAPFTVHSEKVYPVGSSPKPPGSRSYRARRFPPRSSRPTPSATRSPLDSWRRPATCASSSAP
jgi:hypothetical protein